MNRRRLFPAFRESPGLLLIPFLLVGASLLGTRLAILREEARSHESEIPEQERESRFRPELYRILSVGQLPVVVDLLWIQGLQESEVSPHQVWKPREHPLIYYSFNLATTLDPLFFAAYTAGANLLAIVRNDAAGARDLLEKGREFTHLHLMQYPQDFQDRYWATPWHLTSLLTYLYFYPLRDLKAGAQAVREAASYAGAPEYLHDMDKRIERPGGIYEVGQRLLKVLFSRASEPAVREELESKERSLSVAHYLYRLNFGFAKLRAHERTERKESLWKRYLSQVGSRDPWGGSLGLDAEGNVVTTTPFEPVFGLTGH